MVKLWFVLEESLIKKLTKNQKKAVEPLGLWHHLRSLMLSQYPPKIQFLENSHPSWLLSEFFRSIQVPDLEFHMATTLKMCIADSNSCEAKVCLRMVRFCTKILTVCLQFLEEFDRSYVFHFSFINIAAEMHCFRDVAILKTVNFKFQCFISHLFV